MGDRRKERKYTTERISVYEHEGFGERGCRLSNEAQDLLNI